MADDNPEKIPLAASKLDDLAKLADYSLMEQLNCDPDATTTGRDYSPRQVRSGHYVPVKPTPLPQPEYIAHSQAFFEELGFDQSLALNEDFLRFFSGDLDVAPESLHRVGWATGYALSIYGTEYTQQCPFHTGNGYGDGRAISVLEAVINARRWEMQLKGAGRTPYCRGADGRAVLRSSVREFLAQEHMHALGIPTSRSLCLIASHSETVNRPWYRDGSTSADPDIMVTNPTAITTRVAPSFLRVGQLELFARRARNQQHPKALEELELFVGHLIEREYRGVIDEHLSMTDKLLQLACEFRERLTSLLAHWLRVGYCQGNFNSDNCALGGFTLDYGPFGFCEHFDPFFQPWTGGGQHFCFFNQPLAAEKNFDMFCLSLQPLLDSQPEAIQALASIQQGFSAVMQEKVEAMWAAKLGLESYDEELLIQLLRLMVKTPVDYTLFFRELSNIPATLAPLKKSFYRPEGQALFGQWAQWLKNWQRLVSADQRKTELSRQMQQVNPKYTWREWLIAPAYQQAERGDYRLLRELQTVLTCPYAGQTAEVESQYYCLRPKHYARLGGISHYSCSS